MPVLKRIARSILRITIAIVVIATLGLIALTIAVRQPTIRKTPFAFPTRAQPDALRAHVQFLTTDVVPRSSRHTENLDRAASYIEEQFRQSGAHVARQTYPARGRVYTNVIAEFGPSAGTQSVLVVGAHYDAFGDAEPLPGADDNASGTAGLLELARLLGTVHTQQRVLLVAFSTEEPPFFGGEQMGSAIHANQLASSAVPVRGMICLEMIGYFSETQSWPNWPLALLYRRPGDFIAVAGGWSDRELTRVVKRGIAGAGGVPVLSFTGGRASSDASDQRNYWARGWPAVMVSDTAFLRNPNYHTVRDTWQTLDYSRMASVVDGVANAALDLSR